uniref:Uncharacterized protein n=1 Tax=Anguilla anguilla TaxID=7936 RepID=A0A0E9QZA4_ANGAN
MLIQNKSQKYIVFLDLILSCSDSDKHFYCNIK